MKFIGDVHGNFAAYQALLNDEESFQVGDMGVGFDKVLPAMEKHHRFIRGNHDDPAVAKVHNNYAGEYGYDGKRNFFFLGGAFSIDAAWRKAYQRQSGRAIWWVNEELSIEELEKAAELYITAKPELVVTHDAPEIAAVYVLKSLSIGGNYNGKTPTRTGNALSKMFTAHQPKIWIFGHYHVGRDFEMEGTRFICLDILKTFTI